MSKKALIIAVAVLFMIFTTGCNKNTTELLENYVKLCACY